MPKHELTKKTIKRIEKLRMSGVQSRGADAEGQDAPSQDTPIVVVQSSAPRPPKIVRQWLKVWGIRKWW